jgi:enoyl-CoA hydratase/carnithine racemase
VTAAPSAYFALPELALGLIPGSGGTVSIPGRIGRHRAAWLALRGERIEIQEAFDWGLVDELVPATGAA